MELFLQLSVDCASENICIKSNVLWEAADFYREILNVVLMTYAFLAERKSDKMRLYNFDNVKKNRRWLRDVLISDTSDSSSDDGNDDMITEQDLQDMLRLHLLRKKYQARYYTNPEVKEIVYFGCNILQTTASVLDFRLLWH